MIRDNCMPSASLDDVSQISNLIDNVDTMLLNPKNTNNKRANLLRKILDELNELAKSNEDEEQEHDHEHDLTDDNGDLVDTSLKVPEMMSIKLLPYRPSTIIPHPVPYHDSVDDKIGKKDEDLHNPFSYVSTQTALGKISMSELRSNLDVHIFDDLGSLDPEGAEENDVENEDDYLASGTGAYWSIHALQQLHQGVPPSHTIMESDVECSQSESQSESESHSANNSSSDGDCEYDSHELDRAVNAPEYDSDSEINSYDQITTHNNNSKNKMQTGMGQTEDNSSYTSEDSEQTEDRTRMNQHLAPYACDSTQKMKINLTNGAVKKPPRRMRRKCRQSRAQSGSDIPSQSSGDDDEMSYDDEQYAQAISDWRVVLPLERSRSDKTKDEIRAHLSDSRDQGRTHNDFLENLLFSTRGDVKSEQHMPAEDTLNMTIVSDDRGARILASASPPPIYPTSSRSSYVNANGRRIRSWEQQTAASRSRSRSKFDSPVHKPVCGYKKLFHDANGKLLTMAKRENNPTILCYDSRARLYSIEPPVLPSFDMTSEFRDYCVGLRHKFRHQKYTKTVENDESQGNLHSHNDIERREYEKLNMFQQSNVNLSSKNELQHYIDGLKKLIASEVDTQQDSDVDSLELKTSDIPSDFVVSDRWRPYITKTEFTDSSGSEEVLEVFQSAASTNNLEELVTKIKPAHVDVAFKTVQHDVFDAISSPGVRNSLSLEDFMSKYETGEQETIKLKLREKTIAAGINDAKDDSQSSSTTLSCNDDDDDDDDDDNDDGDMLSENDEISERSTDMRYYGEESSSSSNLEFDKILANGLNTAIMNNQVAFAALETFPYKDLVGDFSTDHISPENHPSEAMPTTRLTQSRKIEHKLRKALDTQTRIYGASNTKLSAFDSASALFLAPCSSEDISPEFTNGPSTPSTSNSQFNNVRVKARLASSIDMSGGGLPLAALDDESLSETVNLEVASPAPHSSTPVYVRNLKKFQAQNNFKTVSEKDVAATATLNFPLFAENNYNMQAFSGGGVVGGAYKKVISAEKAPQCRLQNETCIPNSSSPNLNTSHHTFGSGRGEKRTSHSHSAVSPTTKSIYTGGSATAKPVVMNFGHAKPLPKRCLSNEARKPGLPILLRNVLHSGGYRRNVPDIPQRKGGSAYSDIVSALAQTAGVHIEETNLYT